MDKRFLAVLAVIMVFFVGIIIVNNKKTDSSGGGNAGNAQPTNHVEGKGTKNVTLVEYGDYECPICELYYPATKEIAAKYADQIYFQFRNFPLTQVHANAFAGARAAEAASLQNKFWEMHDALYDSQSSWSSTADPITVFSGYAQQLGMDVSKFKTDFTSEAVNNTINADIAAGNKLDITGTPTFFLNGKEVNLKDLVDSKTNQPSAAKFSAVIDKAIASAGK